jgi:hypothetical protein
MVDIEHYQRMTEERFGRETDVYAPSSSQATPTVSMKPLFSSALSAVLLLIGFVCSAAETAAPPPAGAPKPAAHKYEDKENGFTLDVPAGWSAVASANNSILTINNQRPGLKIDNVNHNGGFQGVGGGPVYPPKATPAQILAQLQPGEIAFQISIYIYLGVNDREPMFLDTMTDWPLFLAAHPIKSTDNQELSRLDLGFHKRGKYWIFDAFLREPVSAEDRQKLSSMLASLKLLDAPVANAAWAESLAWPLLPEEIRRLPYSWPHPGPKIPPFTVACEKQADGFLVTFILTTPGSGSTYIVDDTWKFIVAEDGKVTMQSEPPDRAAKQQQP